MRLQCLIILFSFLCSLDTAAHDGCRELNHTSSALFDSSLETILQLTWNVADETAMKNPRCKKEIPSLLEIENFLNDKAVGKKEKRLIAGQEIEGDSYHLDLLEKLIYQKDAYHNLVKDESIRIQSIKKCKNALCALENLAPSKEVSLKQAFLLSKYGFNSSPHVFKEAEFFNHDEINDALRALEQYPNFVFPLESNKQFIRYPKGVDHPESKTTIADATMSFFGNWLKEPSWKREQHVFHEVAHRFAINFKLDVETDWLKLSGWESADGDQWTRRESNQVSLYGQTDPFEDFAEAVVSYRYRPELLKEIAPKKYEYIKTLIFQGVEYLDELKCEDRSVIVKAQQIVDSISLKDREEQAYAYEAVDMCHPIFIKTFFVKDSYKHDKNEKELNTCLKQSLFSTQLGQKFNINLEELALLKIKGISSNVKVKPSLMRKMKFLFFTNLKEELVHSYDQYESREIVKNVINGALSCKDSNLGSSSLFLKSPYFNSFYAVDKNNEKHFEDFCRRSQSKSYSNDRDFVSDYLDEIGLRFLQ